MIIITLLLYCIVVIFAMEKVHIVMFHSAVVLVCLLAFPAVLTVPFVYETALLFFQGRRLSRRRNGDVYFGVVVGNGRGCYVSGAADLQMLAVVVPLVLSVLLLVFVLVLVMRVMQQVKVGRRRRRQGQVVRGSSSSLSMDMDMDMDHCVNSSSRKSLEAVCGVCHCRAGPAAVAKCCSGLRNIRRCCISM